MASPIIAEVPVAQARESRYGAVHDHLAGLQRTQIEPRKRSTIGIRLVSADSAGEAGASVT